MREGARVAVYYAPTRDDPLFDAGSVWLGSDPETGAILVQPGIPDIIEITSEARNYGFHATLKPPMRLASGLTWNEFRAAAAELAASLAPFDLPPLAVRDLHGFLALRETQPSVNLQHLADACVEQLDRFRAPPSDTELARRRRSALTAEQDTMLVRWGYPYVFNTWFFHMTLTRRLSPAEKALYQPRLESHFAAALARARRVTDICLFVQPAPGEAFILAERLKLAG